MSHPIRVVALIESDFVTGPAKNLIEFAKRARVRTRPIELTIVTYIRGKNQTGNAFTAAVETAGIPLFILKESRRYDRSVIPQLRAVLKTVGPDLVQTHNSKSHFLSRISGVAAKYPWIAFHHGYTTTDFKMRVYHQLDRWSLRGARHLVTVCEPFREHLATFGIDPAIITVRHNAVDPFISAADELVEKVRQFAAWKPGNLIAVSIGRLSREKGHQTLIDAVKCLPAEVRSQLTLILVGDGPEREAIKTSIGNASLEGVVYLAGHQDFTQPYLSAADFLVLPSNSEGSPNVLLEGMAAGLPCIATKVGGVPELTTDMEDALLIPPGNAQAMSLAIEKIMGDQVLRSALGSAAHERSRTFNREHYVDELSVMYEQIFEQYCSCTGH